MSYAVWGWIEALLRILVFLPTHFTGTNPLPVMGWWDWSHTALTLRQLSDGQRVNVRVVRKKKTGAEILADVETSPAFVTTEAHFHLRPRFPHLTYAQTHSHQLSATTVENKTGGALHSFSISRHFKSYRTALQCIGAGVDGNPNRFRLLSSSNRPPKV